MHPAVMKFNKLVNITGDKSWSESTTKARGIAQSRSIIVKHLINQDSGLDAAFKGLRYSLNHGEALPSVASAVMALGKLPGRATIYNWVSAYKLNKIEGLLPQFKGKARTQHPWELRCLALYHASNSPSFAQVTDQLVKEGYKCKDFQVRRFITELPHELGSQSSYRIGAKLYREKHKDHLFRSTDNIAPGFIYNGDGHTIDVYCAHPKTGKPYRPELTAFQDVGSRMIVGWELSDAESAISTMTALTRSMREHEHVPAMLYLDNGSGYKNSLMNDKTAGLYAQFEIEAIFAIPGNARAKWIERFFKHMEERVGKRFDSFCGRGHDERRKQLVLKEVKQGKRKLPSVEEWISEFTSFLNDYHNSAHPEIKDKTRQQVWDEIERVDPGIDDYSVLPRAKVNVLRGRVVLHKRTYSADYLHQFNGQELVAGYDLHDDSQINLYQENGEFIMFAALKSKTHALPTSRVIEAEQNRLNGQIKRLAIKESEARARLTAHSVVDVASVEALVANCGTQIEHEQPTDLNLDINDFVIDVQTPQTIDVQSLLADVGDVDEPLENNYEL